MAESYQDIFKTLSEEGTAVLARHGEDRSTAERGGCEFASRVMQLLQKRQVYFPKHTLQAVKAKNAAIKREFEASEESVKTLAKRHGISVVQAYNIIRSREETSKPLKPQAYSAVICITMEAARMLIKHGVTPVDATEASRGIAAVICARWSGRIIYFPTPEYLSSIKDRRQQLWDLVQEGVPLNEIARRCGVTPAGIGETVRKMIAEKGGATPRGNKRKKALYELRKRILGLAETYIGKNEQVSELLKSAAERVDKAREAVEPLEPQATEVIDGERN